MRGRAKGLKGIGREPRVVFLSRGGMERKRPRGNKEGRWPKLREI